jgi:hypothetical protein
MKLEAKTAADYNSSKKPARPTYRLRLHCPHHSRQYSPMEAEDFS